MTSKKKSLNRSIQDAIDRGANTVEEIHKSIADLPLRILQETGVLKGSVKEVRRLQDRSIGAVYDLIREVNKDVGTFASQLRAKATEHRGARQATGAKTASAHATVRHA